MCIISENQFQVNCSSLHCRFCMTSGPALSRAHCLVATSAPLTSILDVMHDAFNTTGQYSELKICSLTECRIMKTVHGLHLHCFTHQVLMILSQSAGKVIKVSEEVQDHILYSLTEYKVVTLFYALKPPTFWLNILSLKLEGQCWQQLVNFYVASLSLKTLDQVITTNLYTSVKWLL